MNDKCAPSLINGKTRAQIACTAISRNISHANACMVLMGCAVLFVGAVLTRIYSHAEGVAFAGCAVVAGACVLHALEALKSRNGPN